MPDALARPGAVVVVARDAHLATAAMDCTCIVSVYK